MARSTRRASVARERVVAHRLAANHLHERLPPGCLAVAARYGLQDTVPRSGLLSLHARVAGVAPSAWEDPSLLQVWSPRSAVHLVPAADLAVFTLGRLPRDDSGQRAVAAAADRVRRALAGREVRKRDLFARFGRDLFTAALSGTIVIRWDTRDTVVREMEAPDADPEAARIELCRRHLRSLGPSTPDAFAWWAGVEPVEAEETWRALSAELAEVSVEGRPAWLLASDEPALLSPPPATGARLLPSEDLKVFGRAGGSLFVGPSRRAPHPLVDWDHPGGLLVDGRLVGAWGRRGGRVDVRLAGPLPPAARAAVEAEALALPVPGGRMSVRVTECPSGP